jgi:RHS repeat-associated protein
MIKSSSHPACQHNSYLANAPEANVLSYTDYYPFGMTMPGRNANAATYRHGFNGMEKDDEIKGSGNSYDFGARIYDPRIGRWLSLDPLMSKYAYLSPYHYTSNSPIALVDLDGKDFTYSIREENGKKVITVHMTFYAINRETYSQAVAAAAIWNSAEHSSEEYTIKFDIQVIKPPVVLEAEVQFAADKEGAKIFNRKGEKNRKYSEIEGRLIDEKMLSEARKVGKPIGQNNVFAGSNNFGDLKSEILRPAPGSLFEAGVSDGRNIVTHQAYVIPEKTLGADNVVFGGELVLVDYGSDANVGAHEIGHNLGLLDNRGITGGIMDYNTTLEGKISSVEIAEIAKNILEYDDFLNESESRGSNPEISQTKGSSRFQRDTQQKKL